MLAVTERFRTAISVLRAHRKVCQSELFISTEHDVYRSLLKSVADAELIVNVWIVAGEVCNNGIAESNGSEDPLDDVSHQHLLIKSDNLVTNICRYSLNRFERVRERMFGRRHCDEATRLHYPS